MSMPPLYEQGVPKATVIESSSSFTSLNSFALLENDWVRQYIIMAIKENSMAMEDR